MSGAEYIQLIEREWSDDDGFFGKLREGVFDGDRYQRAIASLRSVPNLVEQSIEGRLVSLLWYIPLFMEWQIPRLIELGADQNAYSRAKAEILNAVESILGVP